MLNVIVTATLQHIRERHEIAFDLSIGVRQRIAHPGLGREVDEALRTNAPEQFSRALPVREVQFFEAESWPIQKLCRAILL